MLIFLFSFFYFINDQVEGETLLSSTKTVDQLIEFIQPLLSDDKEGSKEDPYEFDEG